jgi:predicted aspartyl protease
MIAWRAFIVASVSIGISVACGIAVAQTSNCKLARVAEWPVHPGRSLVIVDGAVNGEKVSVMLDTGSARTLIMRAAALRLNLAREEPSGGRIFGVGGESRVESALVDEFKVGATVRTKVRMLIAGEQDFGVDVILGEEFLQQVDVEFDLAHDTVRLFHPQNCGDVSLAYWASAGAGEVDIEPLSAVSPQIVLTVKINGQSIKALFDSGASTSVLDKLDAAHLGVTPETPGVVAEGAGIGFGSKSVKTWIGPFQSFTIGNETIKDTEIRFADLFKDASYKPVGSNLPMKVEGLQSMLLGADFLRSHRVLVAHSQRRIYFTYNGGPVFQRLRE